MAKKIFLKDRDGNDVEYGDWIDEIVVPIQDQRTEDVKIVPHSYYDLGHFNTYLLSTGTTKTYKVVGYTYELIYNGTFITEVSDTKVKDLGYTANIYHGDVVVGTEKRLMLLLTRKNLTVGEEYEYSDFY